MLFQTLDDKKECIGVFTDGEIQFDSIPENLTKTWKASSSVRRPDTEYAWLYAAGMELDEVCPEELKEDLLPFQVAMLLILKIKMRPCR